ncbi:hypothetical protein Snoj_55210 [Streptomyces nojiriensis]|uniref:WXG100 family type VII secretion target n=1 Tax=Streptomyces nojiriensis TaxID=66374 RepID=A0ABQ3STX9_9ACTN|nr:hypothetical protein [Streptomyces nojiriensis]QTI45149.1 hypothetical protein JYK04_02932 [Streptomyces nojiriensis]GGR94061.1 hypothetical protein GCM10010205_23460 [Streptomyces nojiriensis]GHI71603.1 hypothetical protein Snoj_55210 [Streptomyces nojiriensis]
MLTYHEILTTDLGLLSTAAAKWESMAGELKKVETRYGDSVQKITMGGDTWSGLSVEAARVKFTATRYEYSAAQGQAKAVASLLRGAHELFTDLRKKLESARDDAVAAGMTVSEQGRVAFDYTKLTPAERSAYHHDPDGQETIRVAVGKWQQHIDDRVKAASDADQHVYDALAAAVVDSNRDAFGQGSGADETITGFNNYAEGDLAKFKKPDEAKAETKTDSLGVSTTGPGQYGKEASVKAYADLFHHTAKGETDLAGLKLSGVADIYGGGRATANAGFTDKGFVAKAEASAGVRALAEGRIGTDRQSAYGRAEGFAGAEAGVSAKATREEVTVGAKAFAGAKGTVAGGVESGGIGVGVTAEGWAGPGAEAWWGYKKDEETGVWKLGGKAGASPLLGGSIGLEITVDPEKVAKTAGDVADAVGDTAHAVGDAAGDLKDWLLD